MCTYKIIGGVVDNKLTSFRTFLANNPTPDARIPTTAMMLVTQAGLLNDLTQHEKNLVEQITRLDKNNNTSYRDALARMAHSGTFLKALEDIYNVQAAARSRSRSRGRSGRSRSRGRTRSRSRGRNGTRSRSRSRSHRRSGHA